MKRFREILKVVGGAIPVLFLFGCGDGRPMAVKPLPSLVTVPSIVSFQVSKVGGEGAPSNSVVIAPGDAVTLEWEVSVKQVSQAEASGALAPKAAEDKDEKLETPVITLDSKEMGIHLEGLDPKGSKEIDKIFSDATFTLTASTSNGTDSKTVTVTVKAPPKPLDVSFTADPTKLKVGEKTNLCWEISRGDAHFAIQDINGAVIYTYPETTSLSEDEYTSNDKYTSGETGGEAPESLKGCKEVYPASSTTYYITVTAEGADEVKKEVTVEVLTPIEIKSFTATPDKITKKTTVVLSWEVSPEDAIVEITPLVEGKQTSKGSVEVEVETNTTFTLKAYKEGEEENAITKEVTVSLEIPKEIKIEASEDEVIFAGEEAEVSWRVVDVNGNKVDVPTKIKGGGEEKEVGAEGSEKVKPSESGEYIIEANAGGAIVQKKVNIVVRDWKGPGANNIFVDSKTQATREITAVGVSKAYPDLVYVGFGGNLVDVGGSLGFKMARGVGEGPVWEDIVVPYMKVLPKLDPKGSGNNPKYFDDFEYPVNAIVADGNNIYIGTTGALLASFDGGKNWETVTGFLLAKDVTLPHPTCFGKSHAGWNWDFKGLSQVCDIAISSSGRFIIATDMLVEYLPEGVEAFKKEGKAKGWKVAQDKLTFGRVNNDLEIATVDGKELLFVGTSNGILASENLGESYIELKDSGAPTGDIYTVKVDASKKRLYAGNSTGNIYVCELAGAGCKNWTNVAVSAQPIYKIELDPIKEGALFVGAGDGIYYSVDGKTWKNVASDPMKKGIAVRGLAAAISKDGKAGIVYAATDEGVFITKAPVIKGGEEEKITPPPAPASETPSPTATSGEKSGGAAVEAMKGML